ncbi:hypothetical protein SDC9_193389 [bioreactor metagenome]|uniref:Uncharacterized protein n=1 Tax=bioreactor metagenome TaxID=1076179 RepID=A0A645I3E3_9ZZZZ
MHQYGIEMILSVGVVDDFSHKTLYKSPIDAIFLHPFEMKHHGGFIVIAVDLRFLSSWKDKIAGCIFYLIFTHIGPHIDAVPAHSGCKHLTLPVMIPSGICVLAM